MKNENIKFKGRIIAFLLIFSFFAFLTPLQNDTSLIQAASSIYSEDFSTTTYMDGAETNVTGWGTGSVENSKKKPTIVGSISSILIGNTIDVFIKGNYAYVTNEGEGLKVVNITDPNNPNIVGSYTTPDIAHSVFVSDDYAFIADYQGDFPQYENFLILDVTDPTNPTHVGNCTTILETGDAANDVVVNGDIAFIANNEGGLSVVNVTDPHNPSLISSIDTAGIASNLAIKGDYIYLADGTNGLVVIDISDPLTPTIVAEYRTGISSATNVIVEDHFVYVIDINNGIVVVNITDPSTPTYTSFWSKTGVSDADVFGDYLYVSDINDGLSVVNVTTLTTPTLINDFPLPGNTLAVVIDGIYAYLVCQSGGFQVIQIADSYFSTTLAGSLGTQNQARSVFVSGFYAYVTDDNSGLNVVDISDPSSPTLVGLYYTPGSAYGIYVSGDYAYVADVGGGLQIIDISDPSSPTFAGSYDTPGSDLDVVVSGDYAYVANGNRGLQVLDISDPSSPTFAGSYDPVYYAYAKGVFVSGTFAYIADDVDGLQVIDISDPFNPNLLGNLSTPGSAQNVYVSGDYAYVADYAYGLQIIDISDPSSPSLAGSYDTPSYALGVFIAGTYAYVADAGSGLQIVDISDPSSPTFAGSYDTPVGAIEVFITGAYAYVADGGSGLQIVEQRNNRASLFASVCVAQSNAIFSTSSATILSATLNSITSIPASTSINYSLSTNGGTNWETVVPGVEHVFIYSGNQLKWKAILTTSDFLKTPIINNLSFDYSLTLIAPALATPTDSYISEDYTPTFTWFGINGEASYLFQLATSSSFTSPLFNLTLPSSSTSYTPNSPLALSTYYWRVAGIDSEGDIGTFSAYRTLYIIEDTSNPIINHPNDVNYEFGTTGHSITWTPEDSNPYWYNVTLNDLYIIQNGFWTGGNIQINIEGLTIGTHTVVCSVYDLEGLMVSDTVEIEVVTTAPPTIDDVADFDYEEGSTGNSITWHPSDANPDYYSITRDGTVIDDGSWLGGDINIDIDGLVYGTYNYVCFVNDTEGQSNSDTVIITITDNVLPLLNTPSDVIYDEGDTGNNIIWIATDNNPATYIVYREGTQVDTDSWTTGSSIIISVDGLTAASYNFTIVVFDEAGNSAKDEVTVGVTPSVPELNQSILFGIFSITVVSVFLYTKRRKYKKD